MDWDKLGVWIIEDLEGNSLTITETLFFAYYRARSLDMTIEDIREIYPALFELVDAGGAVVNTIKKHVH